jgi:hypothetical protein
MSAPQQVASAQRLKASFLRLHAIMVTEQERSSIRGVIHILAVLAEAEINPSLAGERVAEARDFYRSMAAAKGPFSEFYVWRDDFEQRVKENRELDAIKESIWQEFEARA